MPRALSVPAILIAALLLAACGARPEPIETVPTSVITVPDGAGGVTRVRPLDGPVVTTDPGAAETLKALGAPYELVAPTAVARRLVEAPLPRLAVLAPGVEAPAGVPVLRWSLADPGAAGTLVARLGLASGRGAEGVALGRTIDAGVADALARATAAPPVDVLVEGTGAGALAAVVEQLGGRPIPFRGIAAAAKDRPDAWLVTPGTPRSLPSLRRVDELRRVPAVRHRRFAVIDPAGFSPSPSLPQRLADLDAFLRPGS